jgi:hypothetical protein
MSQTIIDVIIVFLPFSEFRIHRVLLKSRPLTPMRRLARRSRRLLVKGPIKSRFRRCAAGGGFGEILHGIDRKMVAALHRSHQTKHTNNWLTKIVDLPRSSRSFLGHQFQLHRSPILNVPFASHHDSPYGYDCVEGSRQNPRMTSGLLTVTWPAYSVTGSHRKPSSQRVICPADGVGKCAVQYRVLVSQHRSSKLRLVTAACLGSKSARIDNSG